MKGMPKILVLTVLSMLAMNAAYAAETKSSGGYIGGSVGTAELDDDGLLSDFGASLDDSDSAAGIFAGYKFNKYFAVEARYSYLGEYSVCGFFCEDIEVDALSVHVIGIIPLGTSGVEIYGQLGIAAVSFEFDSEDETETAGSAGLGIQYGATENFVIGLQVDAYAYEEDGGFQDYDISVTTAQLVAKYIF